MTGIQNSGKTVSVLIRGSNKLVLEEADRSIHDALCVMRCLVKKRFGLTVTDDVTVDAWICCKSSYPRIKARLMFLLDW